MQTKRVRIKLPATSANLGPGFDAAALAMSMHLTVEAEPAPTWQIHATGRDPELVGSLEKNLIIDTFTSVLQDAGKKASPLRLTIHNEIPLGMGCGSSAAALCAGVALADFFGELKMGDAGIVTEASRREGHPDNVAACWLGGFTVSADTERGVETATFGTELPWQLLLAVQATSLATKKARALLPETYSKADAVFNVQRMALLTAAFAGGRRDLLRAGTEDRIHQPYRQDACPLLKALLPLAQDQKFAGVALSGAGPSVLMVLEPETTLLEAQTVVTALAGADVELIPVSIAGGAEVQELA
ncbi:homoserine kinase [Granulicella cerasi]|uniref:homoserine kinase n=1 Tax=Granulicella cerasi TaxID=741063 RepID=UPI0021E043CA|nr:homoserine kinase [Granulicella cerasi]